ncbi:glycosyltransferase involved in cell wall biosynthesis [Mycoplana sp. BE70]|uniref:glycosyltransferase n=1 Tax=Mycoplana sp. BE70 TaxID=2817775 RepID=UPI00285D905E|nr:glycosyltransferase [Mycoplana sp. BE70]MDR6759589.1 glycosyltransferase involved in cell wall biosynthesis [Mycoplana sp. BE70]
MDRHSDKATRRLRLMQVLEPSGGGSGRHFIDLCRGLTQRGHTVHAVYSPRRAEERFVDELVSLGLDGVHPVDMARSPGLSDFGAFANLRRLMRKHGPFDAIHGHSSKAGALARIRLPGRHAPRVYTPHAFRTMDPTLGRTGQFVYGTIETCLARFLTDRVICVSADEYAHARALGMPRKKLSIVVNGVETPPGGLRDTVREAFAIPAEALVFGFVGRLSPQKAPERLVDAFTIAAAKLPEAHLLMVGAGELEDLVRGRINQSPAGARIHLTSRFTGPEAMDAVDAIVMPSRYEAMSYVMLEAASAAKPLILTEVGGASTVLEHGHNGILVPNDDDPRTLANAMIGLADPSCLQRYAVAARLRSNDYDLPRMISETEAIYRSLVT